MNCHWIVTLRGRGPGVYTTHAVIRFLRAKQIHPQDPIRDEDTNAVWIAELWEKIFATPVQHEPLWCVTPCGREAGVYFTHEVTGFLRAKLIQPQDVIRDNTTNAAWTAELWAKVYTSTTQTPRPIHPVLPSIPLPPSSGWTPLTPDLPPYYDGPMR